MLNFIWFRFYLALGNICTEFHVVEKIIPEVQLYVSLYRNILLVKSTILVTVYLHVTYI